jgi:itaconate CoA-transferase
MYALTGILTALFARNETGQGTVVDVSMLEALGEWMGYPLYYSHYRGQAPARTGSTHATIAPYGPYPVGDGHTVYLGIQNEREWARFCHHILQRPEWVTDSRFRDNAARVRNRDTVDALISSRFSLLTRDQVVHSLEQAGIAYAQLNTMEDLWNHPQLRARQRWSTVQTEMGPIEALRPPVNLQGLAATMGPVPRLGEHTDTILQELGYRGAEIVRLRRLGII